MEISWGIHDFMGYEWIYQLKLVNIPNIQSLYDHLLYVKSPLLLPFVLRLFYIKMFI